MTIYSSYTYNQGGLGDFIRSLFAFFVYCKENNIDHQLYIPDHPLNKCFVCITNKLDFPIKNFVDTDRRCDTKLVVEELEKCKNMDYNVIVRSNKFDFVSFDKLKNYANQFKTSLQLSDIVKQRIINLKNEINNCDYTVIHIRCGDKFMECNSQCTDDDIRVNPNSNVLYNKLEKIIEFLKTNYDLPICIFTDVQSLKNNLCNHFKSLGFNTEIHHTASTSDKDNAFIDSVAEFELLGQAKAIVTMSNTGFSFWSAFINNVPLFFYDNVDVVKFTNLIY